MSHTILTWIEGSPVNIPLEVGAAVRVKSYGLGATLEDVGRTGTVTGLNPKRAVVTFDDRDETKAIDTACLGLA